MGDQSCAAEVAHFEVLAPHRSGSRPQFPCTQPIHLAFHNTGFRSLLPGLLFVDVTAFDEHGRVFWAISAAAALVNAAPHSALTGRTSTIDFDRAGRKTSKTSTRWLCLADRGAAQLAVQLEFVGNPDSTRGADACTPPRVNTIAWHVEPRFLDAW